VMNFLLGVVLFGAIYTKLGIPEPVDYLTVTNVVAGSPAEQAGITTEDKIIGFKDNQDFIDFINFHRGEAVILQLADRQVEVMPRQASDTPEGQGALGVAITNIDFVQYPLWQRPARGVIYGTKEAWAWGKEILSSLAKINTQAVAGPVGIYQVSKSAGEQGLLAVFQFTGILSINLAILNLLPLPALDGGRLLFVLIESVSRRRIPARIANALNSLGFALLLALMVVVTYRDIIRLF